MKIYSNIAIALMAAAVSMPVITSCSSEFLDEELTTQRSTDYFNTDEGLEALKVGLYDNLRFAYGFEWSFSTTNYGTDEFIVGNDQSNAVWNDYNSNLSSDITTVNINTTHAYDVWDNMYEGINAANTLLSKMENYSGSNKNELLGTAHFLRGFNYFKLVSQYGGVPIKLTPSTTVEREFTRASKEEVFKQIFNDLRAAYSELPTTESQEGQLTQDAAAHFLAKAYLSRASEINTKGYGTSEWAKGWATTTSADLDSVVYYAKQVIANHALATNYKDLWNYTDPDGANEQLPEIVLAAQFTNAEATKGKYGNNVHLYFVSKYGNLPGMARDVSGGREYQRLRTTYYTLNVFDHINDSRLWKSFRTKANCNKSVTNNGVSYKPGDTGLMFVLNYPGDGRFDATQSNSVIKDLDTDKPVTTTLVMYTKTAKEGDKEGEEDKYIQYYPSCTKYTDGSRSTVSLEPGNRDGILARSAEDYFFLAEAQIRKGNYTEACNTLNTIRQRAQYVAGEDREEHVDGGAAWHSGADGWSLYAEEAGKGIYRNRSSYYESNNLELNSLNIMPSSLVLPTSTDISKAANLPAVDQAIVKELGYSDGMDVALCYLLNEKTREMAGEFVRWEDLSRTMTLAARVKAFNKGGASNFNAAKHYLRAIPQTFLDQIQTNGAALTADQKTAMQNPNY